MSEPPRAPSVAVETVGRWIGPTGRPLLSWLTTPADGIGSAGVVIVPPIGYELWSSHRTLRTLAERLAGQGCSVVRFDYDGTGDSSGDQWDADRLGAWRRDLGVAADSLRRLGVSSLTLVGLRVGASLALSEGSAVSADAVVAWAPVVRGRRYVRELQLLGQPVPEDRADPGRKGAIAQAGSIFSAETLDALGALDLTGLTVPPAARALVVDRDDKPASTALLERLDELGVQVDHLVAAGTNDFLDQPTEYATVADDIVTRICRWVGRGDVSARPPGHETATATVVLTGPGPGAGVAVEEEVVRVGASGLAGVMTRPVGSSRATLVWLNSGSEHHVGPGRAWVEYARALAAAGYTSLRVDFSGWGESPDHGHAPGRPYDAHAVDEVATTVAWLRQSGHRQVVVAGLCAGAWIALRAASTVAVDGVIAINPQLYWQPGEPVEADILTETRVRRQPEIRRNKSVRGTGLWWILDVVGVRHPASSMLRDLDRSGTPVLALFAEGDDGLEFLEDRVGRAWTEVRRHGTVDLVVVGDIDHPMHRHWYRSRVVSALRHWLDARMPPPGDGPPPSG